MKSLLILSLGVSILSLATRAHSAVVAYFEQDGTDVKISWSGTLDLEISGPSLGPIEEFSARISPNFNWNVGSDWYYSDSYGIHSGTPLEDHSLIYDNDSVGSWGFAGGRLYWSSEIVSVGTTELPTQLRYDPAEQVMVVPNLTLAALNADNLNNVLAWTASTTGDTISYTTGPPPSIPEPSTAILLGLATASLTARRCRR